MPLANRESMSFEGKEIFHISPESSEVKKREYHFPEIMEKLEPAMLSCVQQLRNAIETGSYNTLIGDDARGRLPTLILQKIFAEKAPLSTSMQTFFLAFGREGFRWDDAMDTFIKKHKDTFGRALVVTEYVHEGYTLKNIREAFDDENGYTNYDVASLFTNKQYFQKLATDAKMRQKYIAFRQKQGHNIKDKFIPHTLISGEITGREPKFIEHKGEKEINLRQLGGVGRRSIEAVSADLSWWQEDGYPGYTIGAHAERLEKLSQNPEPSQDEMRTTQSYGRGKQEYKPNREIATYSGDELDRRITREARDEILQKKAAQAKATKKTTDHPYSAEENQQIINLAREDVNTMVQNIIAEVWKNNAHS